MNDKDDDLETWMLSGDVCTVSVSYAINLSDAIINDAFDDEYRKAIKAASKERE